MKYQVTVGGRPFEVEVDAGRVTVNGTPHRAELRTVPGTPLRLLLLDDGAWACPVETTGPGGWAVQQWGERYEVEVLDERTRHIRSLVGPGTGHAGPATLKAPMPGLVVRVLTAPGAAVERGQGLVVLEAMKMENELKAPGPGVVDQVLVRGGQAVERGAVLVSFRPLP